MKIGVVRQRYVSTGGAERYLDGVIQELAACDHEVHVFANSWKGSSRDFKFHRVPIVQLTSFLRALTFALSARKILRREQCDLIFSLERTLRQDVYRAGDGCHREWLQQRAKYVSTLKRATVKLNPLHWTLLGLERRTFSPERTGRIIANSHRGKEEIIGHYQFPAERIDVIHNGVDCERFRPVSDLRSGKDVILLFVGTGFERKGLGFCIGALKHLPGNVRLQIMGKGDVERYKSMARKHSVDSRVEFLGTQQDIATVYRGADLLVHPAIYEPFANVCLEALASGLPVITSRINGASEIIEHGKSGAIVDDPGDTVALADTVRPFLDGKFRLVASQHARTVAEAHPFAQNVAETLRVLMQVREMTRA